MSIPANMSSHFASVPVKSAEVDLLSQLGMGGEATHVAAALVAIFAIKAMF